MKQGQFGSQNSPRQIMTSTNPTKIQKLRRQIVRNFLKIINSHTALKMYFLLKTKIKVIHCF